MMVTRREPKKKQQQHISNNGILMNYVDPKENAKKLVNIQIASFFNFCFPLSMQRIFHVQPFNDFTILPRLRNKRRRQKKLQEKKCSLTAFHRTAFIWQRLRQLKFAQETNRMAHLFVAFVVQSFDENHPDDGCSFSIFLTPLKVTT